MDVKKLKEARQHVRLWLDRGQQVINVAGAVQELHDRLDWEIRTLETRPAEADNVEADYLWTYAEEASDRIRSSLPMIPDVDPKAVAWATTTATSSSDAILRYVDDVSQIRTPDVAVYVSGALSEYRNLQETHQLPRRVRNLLKVKLPSAVAIFDAARDAYERWKSGLSAAPLAAIEMRTLLDVIKGELFERARGHKGENMTAALAIRRLASSEPDRNAAEFQFDQRGSLVEALSAVAKRRNPPGAYELETLWARVLDHAMVVIGLLK